jgi:maltooligosyltrehalose trehalohydrolase
MAINLAEVGASCSTDAGGTLQITFGLYLPGIRSTDGFGVAVRVIHDADRFDPAVPTVDEAMNWTPGSALDLWTATATLTPDPNSHYGQEGLYLYRFQLWWTPAGGAKQLITEWFPDPFARETDLGMLSGVTCMRQTPAPFTWTDGTWRTPELDSLVVYEAQVEQFNDTFAGVADRLIYLKSLGVNCIELMPVTSTKLDFDWGYGPLHYFAPHAAFGGVAGLKALVDACHADGVAVILDVVYQHVDDNFAYYRVYADVQASAATVKPQSPMISGVGEFGPQVDFSQVFAQEYCQLANQAWLDDYHVDGFRYDEVTDLYQGPTDTAYALLAYETYLYSRSIARFGCAPGIYSRLIQCAEALWKAPDVLRNTYTNAAWQEGLLGPAEQVAAGDYSTSTLTTLAHALDPFFAGTYPSTKTVVDSTGAPVDMPVAPFQYLNCHDKSHLITFAGTTSSDFLAPGNRSLFYRIQPLLVALYTCQGVPMLWEGEEFVDDYQLPPSGAARINLRRDVHWEYFYDDYGAPVIRLCRTLGALRTANPALRSRQSYYYYQQSLAGNAIVAYHRHAPAAGAAPEQYAMVVINFGQAAGQISLPFPAAGVWTEAVDATARAGAGLPPLTVAIAAAGGFAEITVPSNYGYVFLSS